MRDSFRADDRGVASTMVTFIVAGALFVGAVGIVLVTTQETAQGSVAATAPAVQLSFQARNLAQTILTTPGVTTSGTDWGSQALAGGDEGSLQGANELGRLGLREPGSDLLSFEKLQNLRLSQYAADAADGFVNYPEARAGFGLDSAGMDFHIRAYPALESFEELVKAGRRDPNLRVTYIGNIDVTKEDHNNQAVDPSAGLAATAPACTLSPLAGAGYRLSTTVTNGGTVSTQFTALFTYELGETSKAHQETQSFLVPPGGTAQLYVDVPESPEKVGSDTHYRQCAAGSTIKVEVNDLGSAGVTPATTTIAAADALTGAAAGTRNLWLDTSKPHFLDDGNCDNDNQVVFHYGEYKKNNVGDLQKDEKIALRVYRLADPSQPDTAANRVQVYPSGNPSDVKYEKSTVKEKEDDRYFNIGCLPAGEYFANFHHYTAAEPSETDTRVQERLLVVSAEVPPYTPPTASGSDVYAPAVSAQREVEFVEQVIEGFCPTYWDSQADTPMSYAVDWGTRCSAFKPGPAGQDGDVLPDTKDAMNDQLRERLVCSTAAVADPTIAACFGEAADTPRFDIVKALVVGSDVDQSAMTSAAAKHAVRDWVYAGGTLVVMGSSAQNVQWLQPLFHAAISASSGSLGTPDPGHPLLHTPNELDYPSYDNNGNVWTFNGPTAHQAADLFGNVVVAGDDAVTTISDPGAFGTGRIILTAWEAYDIYGDGNMADPLNYLEGTKLMHNLLMQGYRDLFLDYGPPLPDNANVIPAVDVVSVQHPDFLEPIELKVDVYLFG